MSCRLPSSEASLTAVGFSVGALQAGAHVILAAGFFFQTGPLA